MKLSEMKNEDLILAEDEYNNFSVINKTDYLNDINGYVNIFVAEENIVTFDLEYMLENYEDETHEDWAETVYEELLETNISETIQKVFNSNPTYFEGEKIIDDVSTETESEEK